MSHECPDQIGTFVLGQNPAASWYFLLFHMFHVNMPRFIAKCGPKSLHCIHFKSKKKSFNNNPPLLAWKYSTPRSRNRCSRTCGHICLRFTSNMVPTPFSSRPGWPIWVPSRNQSQWKIRYYDNGPRVDDIPIQSVIFHSYVFWV